MKTVNNYAAMLSKTQMRRITGGMCNPGSFYGRPCTNNLQCGGPSCANVLYCYIPPKSSSGTCLFR